VQFFPDRHADRLVLRVCRVEPYAGPRRSRFTLYSPLTVTTTTLPLRLCCINLVCEAPRQAQAALDRLEAMLEETPGLCLQPWAVHPVRPVAGDRRRADWEEKDEEVLGGGKSGHRECRTGGDGGERGKLAGFYSSRVANYGRRTLFRLGLQSTHQDCSSYKQTSTAPTRKTPSLCPNRTFRKEESLNTGYKQSCK